MGETGPRRHQLLNRFACKIVTSLDAQNILPFRCQQLLERAIDLEPNRPEAHLLLGLIYHKLALSKEDRINKYQTKFPSDIRTEFNFRQQATDCLRSAIRLDPRNANAFQALGESLLAAHQGDENSSQYSDKTDFNSTTENTPLTKYEHNDQSYPSRRLLGPSF